MQKLQDIFDHFLCKERVVDFWDTFVLSWFDKECLLYMNNKISDHTTPFWISNSKWKFKKCPPNITWLSSICIQKFTCLTRISVGVGNESLRLLIGVETRWKGPGAWWGLCVCDEEIQNISRRNPNKNHKSDERDHMPGKDYTTPMI